MIIPACEIVRVSIVSICYINFVNSEFALEGDTVRLEPLSRHHRKGLAAAANIDRSIYQYSLVPQSNEELDEYIDTAISWRNAGSAVPFATIRKCDDVILGSTRFCNIERWRWPQKHERHGRQFPDACEIGYSWLRADALRSGANAEAKLLMLTYAFEHWGVLRVCIHTDVRNERSRRAIERLGARFEGVLRYNSVAADATPRNSCRYSIVREEWPTVKRRLSD